MADDKTHTLAVRVSLFCLLSSVLCPLSAEELPDPTRPPAEISMNRATSGQPVRSVNNGLQSIIISPTRRAAIINGQTVQLGEKYGGAELVEVNERGVVLLGKQGKQRLALFPNVKLSIKGEAPRMQNETAKPPRQKMTPEKRQEINDQSANPVIKPTTPEEEK